jgi:hypothetical protein
MLVIIAAMVGGFFGYNFWKDQQAAKLEAQKAEARAKAERPFFVAAREALDEAHKMQSAIGVGLNYQKYGDELIVLATKVDNLLRAAVDTGIQNLKPDAKVFCQKLEEAREAFLLARRWWDLKIKNPQSSLAKEEEWERCLQEAWAMASKHVDEADRVYSRLKNQ